MARYVVDSAVTAGEDPDVIDSTRDITVKVEVPPEIPWIPILIIIGGTTLLYVITR